ncbi:hypothetical protein HBI12_171720 [Parastagonospora nodorum]|nr:hypothetical protein HBI12_171720 [Parastagonospora nodorum]
MIRAQRASIPSGHHKCTSPTQRRSTRFQQPLLTKIKTPISHDSTSRRADGSVKKLRSSTVGTQPFENTRSGKNLGTTSRFETLELNSRVQIPESQSNSMSTAKAAGGGTRSSSWSAKDDETLIQARAQGLNWNQISPKHFPQKSANACRKRHQRLMERQNAEQWDGIKLGDLGQAYMAVRREIWSILAAKVGEKWMLVEQKCMEKGLKNLNLAARVATKRQIHGASSDHQDSGGSNPLPSELDNTGEEHSELLSTFSGNHHSQQQRNPSIQSMIHPYAHPYNHQISVPTPKTNTTHLVPLDEACSVEDNPAQAKSPEVEPFEFRVTAPNRDIDTGQAAWYEVQQPRVVIAEPHRASSSDIECQQNDEQGCVPQGHFVSPPISRATGARNSLDRTDLVIQHIGPKTPQSGHISPNSNYSEDELLETTEDSLDDSSPGGALGIHAQKEEILDRLMVYFYQIFTATNDFKRHGEQSSTPSKHSKQSDDSSDHPTASRPKKRKSGDRDEGNKDREDEGGGGKRRRESKNILNDKSEASKRLACPYFKRKPLNYQPKRACSGPGWLTVHRLKEHLYREHAMSPHCRRCYTTFENETQLTDHSRSTDTCVVTNALPPEGFDKDQEKKLKNRSKMFRADSEEQKWQIVYVILFPDTAPSELPSAYYDLNAESASDPPEDQSPKAPELKQFDAFMRRELPRKVRKALEVAMEKLFGPVEETLKNELETIVRDCHETLTRTFLSAAQAMASSGSSSAMPTHAITPECAIDLFNSTITMDGLSQIALPPNSTREAWHEVHDNVENQNLHPTWSDSAYFSQGNIPDFTSLGDTWPQDGIVPGAGTQNNTPSNNYFQPASFSEDFGIIDYVGKGKGRAEDSIP